MRGRHDIIDIDPVLISKRPKDIIYRSLDVGDGVIETYNSDLKNFLAAIGNNGLVAYIVRINSLLVEALSSVKN